MKSITCNTLTQKEGNWGLFLSFNIWTQLQVMGSTVVKAEGHLSPNASNIYFT